MIFIYLLSLLSLSCIASGDPLLIGTFNIQVFGQAKMLKPKVVNILIQIVQRYDVLMVQEIRDSKQTAFPELVDRVNRVSNNHYEFVVSPRTGRTDSKEQYGYIFNTAKVKVIDEFQYTDDHDEFEREPYIVRFERLSSRDHQKIFTCVVLHAKPDDAAAEMNALVDVYDMVATKYHDKDVVMGGDFNADCRYVCKKCWKDIKLKNDNRFTWLIASSADTTSKSSDCAYDRLVIAGSSMTANSRNANVFYFEDEYKLSYEEACDVSDHRPVEFYLY